MPHGAPAPLFDWARWNGRKARTPATSTTGRPPIWERYQAFIKANPHVLKEALHLARGRLAAGQKRIGAKALWEELRTSIKVKKLGSYKLDNDYTALVARDLIAADPRLERVIELRERKTAMDKAVDKTTPIKEKRMPTLRPMSEAPTGPEILVRTTNRAECHGWLIVHHASGGGEEQPRFLGWFFWTGYDFAEIDPKSFLGWIPLPEVTR